MSYLKRYKEVCCNAEWKEAPAFELIFEALDEIMAELQKLTSLKCNCLSYFDVRAGDPPLAPVWICPLHGRQKA